MRHIIVLMLLGLCGCTGVRDGATASRTAGPGDTLAAIAEQRYGAAEYAGLVAYHNGLAPDSLTEGVRVELPPIDEMVSGLSALEPHRPALDEILRGRARFAAALADLRDLRAGVPLGLDRAVPPKLQSALTLAADRFEHAREMLAAQRHLGDTFPERVDTTIELVVDEIRAHAVGRYYTRPLSVGQTQRQVARIFAELVTWQRVLVGELSPKALTYPRPSCG